MRTSTLAVCLCVCGDAPDSKGCLLFVQILVSFLSKRVPAPWRWRRVFWKFRIFPVGTSKLEKSQSGAKIHDAGAPAVSSNAPLETWKEKHPKIKIEEENKIYALEGLRVIALEGLRVIAPEGLRVINTNTKKFNFQCVFFRGVRPLCRHAFPVGSLSRSRFRDPP